MTPELLPPGRSDAVGSGFSGSVLTGDCDAAYIAGPGPELYACTRCACWAAKGTPGCIWCGPHRVLQAHIGRTNCRLNLLNTEATSVCRHNRGNPRPNGQDVVCRPGSRLQRRRGSAGRLCTCQHRGQRGTGWVSVEVTDYRS